MSSNAARNVNFDSFPAAPPVPAGRPSSDPLAELARIVGQDDPFRALLEARDGRPAAQPQVAPAPVAPAPVAPHAAPLVQPAHRESAFAEAPALRGPIDAAPEPAPADAFDRYLAEVETRGTYHPDPDAALPPGPSAPPRSRRLLVSVGAALGVVTVAVAGGLTWKNMRTHPVGSDGAPVVMADKAPLKVAPQNAGGVEIPGQDKQIYERGTKDKPTRVVNREEQPVDVAQVARQAAARDAVPGAGNALQESLGEPRRVRTVAVRPEMPERPASPPPAATATPSPVPMMTMPTATAPSAQPARRPTPEPVTTAAAAPRVAAPTPVAAAPAAPTTPASTTPAPRPQRVASASLDVAIPVETTPAQSGGFAVQLAVRPSDKEARVAFKQIQERYSAELGGRAPIIRQAEVSGKTVYRIRVGAPTLEDANALCGKLKASGGQCFVAKN